MRAGWTLKRIGEVCEVIAGQSPEGKFYNSEGHGVPFYQGKKDFGDKFISNPTAWTTKVTKLARAGDILMSVRAPVGPINFANEEICIGRGLAAIRIKQGFDRHFLFYQLEMLQPRISGRAGAVFASIGKSEIEEIDITVPPLEEQHRIVRILDEAFAAIAKAKANTEKNLQNALALFETHRHAFLRKGKNQWNRKKLSDFAEVQSGGTPAVSRKELWFGGIPWYSSGELNGLYTSAPQRHISSLGLEQSNAKLFPVGSLLIGMYDTAALKMSILDRDACFNQAIAGVRPNETVSMEFLLHAISVQKPQLLSQRRGVRQKNLSLRKIQDFVVPVPPLPEQKAIVSMLHEIKRDSQQLQSLSKEKLTALDALKQSLLHQAFSGSL